MPLKKGLNDDEITALAYEITKNNMKSRREGTANDMEGLSENKKRRLLCVMEMKEEIRSREKVKLETPPPSPIPITKPVLSKSWTKQRRASMNKWYADGGWSSGSIPPMNLSNAILKSNSPPRKSPKKRKSPKRITMPD